MKLNEKIQKKQEQNEVMINQKIKTISKRKWLSFIILFVIF